MKKLVSAMTVMVILTALKATMVAETLCADFPTQKFRTQDEKRSMISIAVGYACVGKDISKEEGATRALTIAKRFALRKSHEVLKQRISSIEGNLEFEMLPYEPGNFVNILAKEITSSPIRGSLTSYGIRITAEVSYRIVDDHHSGQLLTDSNLPLTVRAWSDQERYHRGENVIFYIQGNKDYYTRIIDVAPGGEMIQILPNLFRQSHSFKGGLKYRFPDPGLGDDFELTVEPPFGTETVLVFASEVPIGDIAFSEYIGQFGVVQGKSSDIAKSVRKISPIPNGAKEGTGTFSYVDFYESHWKLTTSE